MAEVFESGGASYLRAASDALPATDEAHLSVGDSGGALFINDLGIWKLAGINYAVDGQWDFDGLANGDGFNVSLFDAGGLHVGSDAAGWNFVPDQILDEPSSFYSTRISGYAGQILAITGLPEPGAMAFLMFGAALFLRHRRPGD